MEIVTVGSRIIQEGELKAAKDRIEDELINIKCKIHRFPVQLRRIGKEMDYIAPRMVSIGPYYHGQPELRAMEEVKRMAAYCFCEVFAAHYTPEQVYDKILPTASAIRGCYVDADALRGITDADLATMMFFDGCFLVQCFVSLIKAEVEVEVEPTPKPMRDVIYSKGAGTILRDIMLLENQMPWPVVQLLIDLGGVPMEQFVSSIIANFDYKFLPPVLHIDSNFKPPHLLGLIRFYQGESGVSTRRRKRDSTQEKEMLARTTSAAELAENGVRLTPSGTSNFLDMSLENGPLFATLTLPPLFLNCVTSCWFANMAALEKCTRRYGLEGLDVSSYISVVAQLINREEDVHELCRRRILHTTYDYHQTLNFFSAMNEYLSVGHSYVNVLGDLALYKRRRWMWLAVYKFVRSNAKEIAALLSIVGVLVGIFKALLSLNLHQQ